MCYDVSCYILAASLPHDFADCNDTQYESVFHLFIILTAPETPKLKIHHPQQEVYTINYNLKRVKMKLTFQVSADTFTCTMNKKTD